MDRDLDRRAADMRNLYLSAMGRISQVPPSIVQPSARQYSIKELLDMRKALPYVSCPVRVFKPEAWSEKILPETVLPGGFVDNNERRLAKTIAAAGPENSRVQEQLGSREVGGHNGGSTPTTVAGATRQPAVPQQTGGFRREVSGRQPRQVQVPVAQELGYHGMEALGLPVERGVSLEQAIQEMAASRHGGHTRTENELSGGFGELTLGAGGYPSQHIASHGFVPGGTLKTVPTTGLERGYWNAEGQWINQMPRTLAAVPQQPMDAYSAMLAKASRERLNGGGAHLVDRAKENTGYREDISKGDGISDLQSQQLHSSLDLAKIPPSLDKGKGKDPVDPSRLHAAVPTPSAYTGPPPPVLMGNRSSYDEQMAFLQYMRRKVIDPQKQHRARKDINTPGNVTMPPDDALPDW